MTASVLKQNSAFEENLMPSYSQLAQKNKNSFTYRHIGSNNQDMQKMLDYCGYSNLSDMTDKILPEIILGRSPMNLPEPMSEAEFLAHITQLGQKNKKSKDLIGQGYYGTFTPSVIQRNIFENPAWYTAYTPYQPEISQGRLEALLNFQTMIASLTGMEIANASLLDEGTAAAEAMTLCRRQSKSKSNLFFVSDNLHPQIIDIIVARAKPMGYEILVAPADYVKNNEVFGAIFSYPATDGSVTDLSDIIENVKSKNGLVAVACDLLSLTMLKTPAEMGADIAFGNSQRFGVPFGFGGPHAAFFACHDAFKRNMAGRLVGVSVDSRGKKAYRLALQTREQHIRREKATSNICTAQALLAIIAASYACYHGAKGLLEIAQRTHLLGRIFVAGLNHKYELVSKNFFDTIILETGGQTQELHEKSVFKGYNLRKFANDKIGISFDETCDEQTVMDLWSIFGVKADFETLSLKVTINQDLPTRTSKFLEHKVFNSYHDETKMMRYLRSLADKDLALDRAMIPLGSCTMKLNSATEMMAVTQPNFANTHPFRPLEQAKGYLEMIASLEDMLCEVTGFDAVSLQPNSGASGELAGLMAIAGYHASRGEKHRDICLIPASAHGTNPASAVMAAMKVVVVKCDNQGNIDMADFREKTQLHKDNLSALMVTYPSTHGVFEESIVEICELIHKAGGQVYMDGANMNAQVGLTSPAFIGADVCHLNLHKTFCIPHGGGGPGVGPIGVKSQLIPFLPGHSHLETAEARFKRDFDPVASAPFGSAGILSISYAYVMMMGNEGLTLATQMAILSANYIAKRLNDFYPVLYTGKNEAVAHEVIIDCRPLKEKTGVSVDDIAKRLADYGFHAPTMSFPVAGTLMIEPTESESLYEIDRFCEAMIKIRSEADAILQGAYSYEESPLYHAPHTADMIAGDEWNRAYSKMQAVFPNQDMVDKKYWPASSRIDHVYGDRNVVCSCPDISDYE